MSCGGGIRTHVTELMRLGWNLSRPPRSRKGRTRTYVTGLMKPGWNHLQSTLRIYFANKKTASTLSLISSAVRLSLIKAFCFKRIYRFLIRLPSNRIEFLGIIRHSKIDILLSYVAKRRIFISLIIVVLTIIISFSIPESLCFRFLSPLTITRLL